MRKLVLGGLLLTACVSGKDLIGPEDPQYEALCVDSTQTDPTKACWDPATIEVVITIENPKPTP